MKNTTRLTTISASATLLLLSAIASAADAPVKSKFDISAQPLAKALNTFALQAKLNIYFDPPSVEGIQSPALNAELTVKDAINRLLTGTQLQAVYVDEKTIRIILSVNAPKKTLSSVSVQESQSGEQLAALVLAGADPEQIETEKDSKNKKSQKPDTVEEMVVEDSRIKPFAGANVDLPRTINDPQPYYIFDNKEIERSGALNIQDFLKQRLTMDTTFQTNNDIYLYTGFDSGIGGAGIAGSNLSSFNLRGLGANKTLILVNGRRRAGVNHSAFNSELKNFQPDLNGIPLASIDRIEVLPSGASAIYGGSAIGGVINVVLKQGYQGGEVRYSYDAPSSSSASTSTADANYGFSFEGGRSHLTTSLHYSTSDPMVLGDRINFVQNGLNYLLTVAKNNPTINLLQLFATQSTGPTGVNLVGETGDIILKDGTNLGRYARVLPGVTSATPYSQRFASGYELTPSPGYGPWGVQQALGTPITVRSFNAEFRRDLSSKLTMFAEVMVSENSTSTTYNSVNPTRIVSTDVGSPFLTGQVNLIFPSSARFPVETRSLTRSATLGLKSDLFNSWTGEFDYTLSQNTFDHSYYFLHEREARLDFNAGLIDFLVDPFSAPPDMTPYSVKQRSGGFSKVDDIALRLAGPMMHLPWGDPILSIGLQRNKVSNPQSVSVSASGGLGSSLGDPRTTNRLTYFANSQISDALYVEGLVPLVTDKNAVPLVRSLDLQVAQRISRYIAQTGTQVMTERTTDGSPPLTQISYTPVPVDAVGGNGGTPRRSSASYGSHNETFALRYQPTMGVTVRASLGTGFVPPTYTQLIPDKRLNPRPNGGKVTNPVTGARYDVDTISGGNPNLRPQRSKSMDMGVIYEPQQTALKGLRANLQYYQTSQFDFIGTLSPDQILSVPELATERVTRDPLTGLVTQVDVSYVNIAEYSTAGLDLSLSYDMPTKLGAFGVSLAGTRITYERRQSTVNSPMLDYAGFPGYGGPVKYKANANLNWDLRNWSAGWNVNWSGSYRLNGTPGAPGGLENYSSASWVLQGSYSVPSQMYHNLFVSYDFGRGSRLKWLADAAIQLNVQNVLNTVPPFDVSRTPFYFSPLGSYRLRAYALTVKKGF